MPRLAPIAAVALSALAFAAVAAPPVAGDPESVVRHLYEVKRAEVAQWKSPPGAPGRREAFAATAAAFKAAISRTLAEAIEKDARSAEGGPGRFNADPLLWGQEFDDDVLHDLRVELMRRAEARASVRVRFTNTLANKTAPVEVLFELCYERGRWRIEDIRSAGQSFVVILSGP